MGAQDNSWRPLLVVPKHPVPSQPNTALERPAHHSDLPFHSRWLPCPLLCTVYIRTPAVGPRQCTLQQARLVPWCHAFLSTHSVRLGVTQDWPGRPGSCFREPNGHHDAMRRPLTARAADGSPVVAHLCQWFQVSKGLPTEWAAFCGPTLPHTIYVVDGAPFGPANR